MEKILIDEAIEEYDELILNSMSPQWRQIIKYGLYVTKYNIQRESNFIEEYFRGRPVIDIREENEQINKHIEIDRETEDTAYAYPVPQNIKDIRRIF